MCISSYLYVYQYTVITPWSLASRSYSVHGDYKGDINVDRIPNPP